MIYCTSWDNISDIGSLLKEWTGRDINTEFVLWNSYFIVAKDNNEFIGCAQLVIIDDPFWNRRWGLVENVFVKDSYRKCGVGKQLMERVEIQAKLFGCKFIKLTSGFDKMAGIALYESLGYEKGYSFRKEL